MEVTRVCFDEEFSFRNEVPKGLLGGHIEGEKNGEVKLLGLVLF